jgi:hypothetical protein
MMQGNGGVQSSELQFKPVSALIKYSTSILIKSQDVQECLVSFASIGTIHHRRFPMQPRTTYPPSAYPPAYPPTYPPAPPSAYPPAYPPAYPELSRSKPKFSRPNGAKFMFAGGAIAVAIGLLLNPKELTLKKATASEPCLQVLSPKAVLSRDRLSQFLTVAERSSKDQVRTVMQEPYCQLPDVQVRAGATAQREAYPLAFDPNTWLVVLYEGNEYAGYDFSFRR